MQLLLGACAVAVSCVVGASFHVCGVQDATVGCRG
jgi:hypothetical protein